MLLLSRPWLRSWNLKARLRGDSGDGVDWDFIGSRGIIVLFEKQVHLQKDVGAID